jgi:hypothetical protein
MTRKTILSVALSLSAMAATAQNKVGEFSLKPMIGINVSNFSSNEDITYDSKVNFTGGVEAEYIVMPWLGVSLGAFYLHQSSNIESNTYTYIDYSLSQQRKIEPPLTTTGKLKFDCISLPILANIYVYKGLALKVGVQMDFLMNDKLSFETYFEYEFDKDEILIDGSRSSGIGYVKGDCIDPCKNTLFGIPVGLSYEYKNIILYTRYYFSLSNINNMMSSETIHNHYISITLGYKFKF